MLHGTVHRLTRIYEQFGQCFPKYERYEAGSARGKVLVCPPNVTNSAMLRNLGKVRTAILTGWAVDSNCRYRYRCDAAFPLSDHADFPDLVEFVKQVRPKKVYTLHGFAADFAQHLRQLGFEAHSLSQNEQFALALNVRALPRQTVVSKDSVPKPTGAIASAGSSSLHGSSPDLFVDFARVSDQIAANPGKLEKIRLLAEYLQSLQPANVSCAATWFSGRPLPATQNKVLQLGWAILRDSLCSVTGADQDKFNQVYLKHSDLGETANELMQSHVPEPSLQLQEIDELFQKLHAVRGPLAKTPLLIHALQRATALEAKYLVKIITGDLRIGLKEGLVEEAIAKAFVRPADEVRQANLLLGDIGETASLAKQNKLKEASLQPFRPVKFMLASPEETSTDILNRVQEWNSSLLPSPEHFQFGWKINTMGSAASCTKSATGLHFSREI